MSRAGRFDSLVCWFLDRKSLHETVVRARDAQRAAEAVAAALLADCARAQHLLREVERERDELRRFLEVVQ